MLAKPILLAKPVEGRSPVSLSVTEVRAIVLRSQRLAEDLLPFGLGKTAVLKAIQHLGYIQVDPINVLQRAHHHVLWSRVPNYHPDMLHELQDPDAAVFEYCPTPTSPPRRGSERLRLAGQTISIGAKDLSR
jgi:uncharacterized protein YcaQ